METDDKTGWVSLHRKSIDSTVFQNPIYWYVWTWCLLKANHRDNKFLFNGKDIMVKRGQFITGRARALKELQHLTPRKYRSAVEYLKTTNRIATQTTNKFTIVTVCNYDHYQNKNEQNDQLNNPLTDQPATNQRPTNDQPATTNNNVNNVNNVNNNNNPRAGKKSGTPKPDFINEIISAFKISYENFNQIPYEITNEGKERSAAGKLLQIHKNRFPDYNTDQILESMQVYFDACVSINDDWLRKRMTLPILLSEFNKINNILKHGRNKAGGATDAELAAILAKHFGTPNFDSRDAMSSSERENLLVRPLKEDIICFCKSLNLNIDQANEWFSRFESCKWRDKNGKRFADDWNIWKNIIRQEETLKQCHG